MRMIQLTYTHEGKEFCFRFDLRIEADRQHMMRIMTWAVYEDVSIKLTPVILVNAHETI